MKLSGITLALLAGLPAALAATGCSGDAGQELPDPSAAAAPEGAAPEADAAGSDVYVIRMTDDPVVAYEGSIPGLPATRSAPGQRVDPTRTEAKLYAAHLQALHDAVLDAAGGRRLYDYHFSFNGMAAVLTPSQAAAIAAMPEVAWVERDELRLPVTDNTPHFLELDTGDGLWSQVGGLGHAGEDVIIGVVDTGIWPEHPSFSDQAGSSVIYGPPPARWRGVCQAGEQWSSQDCNNKLIGARYFPDGFLNHGGISGDWVSARDAHGHGTHTASTAGGNYGVAATLLGVGRGPVSGMAPRARIAAYKACWANTGCYLSDLTKAIDQAVSDGVDVINYSIGSSVPKLTGADGWAFLFAQNAGVFVAVAAGNSGPMEGTVGSPATVPWVTSVGASTQNRTFEGSVALSSGGVFEGASITGGTAAASPLVDASQAAIDPGWIVAAEQCYAGKLDPAVVSGAVVLCKRGGNSRAEKSVAVHQAGGVGMILYNTDNAQPLSADAHCIPTTHVSQTDGFAIKAQINQSPGLLASIEGGTATLIPAPWMAYFSSRGPDRAAPDILKPDVTAPGVNVLAGSSPEPMQQPGGELFQLMSGTSMATPHVAGVGALLRQAHPDWTAAMIRSALATTASQSVAKENGQDGANPFEMGSGHIAPGQAVDPGLVYDAGMRDYVAFLCGVGAMHSFLCPLLAGDPTDLNLPSIGVYTLAGTKQVKRTITNVGPSEVYRLSINAPPGVRVHMTVSGPPGSWDASERALTLQSGESATYRAAFVVQESAILNEWTFGAITWTSPTHHVRIPVALRPVAR